MFDRKGFTVAFVLLSLAAPLRGETALTGHWQSSSLELALTSDFHKSVYGSGAKSVRSVTMTIKPSGEGVFQVMNSVRDRQGRVVTGTQEIEDVTFSMGDLVQEPGRPAHYTTHVMHAERRFTDDPKSAFAHDGVMLGIYRKDDKAGEIEVRFDTPEGTGSFWETLRHAAARPAARTAKPAA
jgi:hypothetical protein